MSDIILDNQDVDRIFRGILAQIPHSKNGVAAGAMAAHGAKYRVNWGVSVTELRKIASAYERNHLLALKLWNKQWRETMILATLLDEPALLSEEQMDYWTKSCTTVEMIEQAVANLFIYSKTAFAKALQYCCGKSWAQHYTGLQLLGRLAMTDETAIDEMFEAFFEVLPPLAKASALSDVFYRTIVLLAERNERLHNKCLLFLETLYQSGDATAQKMAVALREALEQNDIY
ncbi:MAG: DNA alkylation repair protein [Bacteroidales bacterium]|jgi:hypothetical protein|nr:DNA alkylation repair protein [Bacteroidales bacterium]